MKKILEVDYNPRIHVKEYKRKCNECNKVWHSLESREKEVSKDISNNNFQIFGNCCNPSAQLQAKRNVESGQSELDRLKKCPECGSHNYKQDAIIYEKK